MVQSVAFVSNVAKLIVVKATSVCYVYIMLDIFCQDELNDRINRLYARDKTVKTLKNNLNVILLCLFEIVIGVLLLINPIGFTIGTIITTGIVLLIIGLISVIKYFRAEAKEAATGQYLLKGLVELLFGAFCIFKSNWFVVTFPALTLIYGVVILVTGLGKVQITVDMIRAKNKKWFLAAISALLSVSCAVVILNNPFTSTAVLWMFTGITLIIEAVFDIITLIVSGSGKTEE